jgi:hypothetical protein
MCPEKPQDDISVDLSIDIEKNPHGRHFVDYALVTNRGAFVIIDFVDIGVIKDKEKHQAIEQHNLILKREAISSIAMPTHVAEGLIRALKKQLEGTNE